MVGGAPHTHASRIALSPSLPLPLYLSTHTYIHARLGRPELALVRVGRLVQVDVARPLLDLKRRQQRQQRATLLGGRLRVERAARHHLAVWVEGAVRVDRLRVPPLHRLVSPRADTGHDQQVEDGAVRRARRLQEEQRALDAACLVSVHAAGHLARRGGVGAWAWACELGWRRRRRKLRRKLWLRLTLRLWLRVGARCSPAQSACSHPSRGS
eukprot:scaffold3318_cov75-Phaeocystis_antarctica.AAC.4